MIKHFILFILLSLGSVTTAFAIPTVSEIESTIASGDYKEAKSKLNEVLKVHPDSVVANKYMLEINIPANSKAVVHLPTTETDKITDYGMPLSKDNTQVIGNETIVNVGSGHYYFECPYSK